MKFTIITATFNNEKTIRQTIESVLNQSYKNIEYIIIDGKSNDNTLKIIDEYQKQITRIISEPDKGIYDALNKGIQSATGDIIGFLHADDTYAHENTIQNIVNQFQITKSDAVYGDLIYVLQHNPDKIVRFWKADNFQISKLKKGWMPPHPTLFIKHEIYQKFGGFNTKYNISADYDLILRFLGKHQISCSYLPEVIVKMRTGGKSNSGIINILKKMREDLHSIKSNKIGGLNVLFFKNFSKLPQLLSYFSK